MAKNFYNLPSAWNPGYAEPESVMDEGLERRAFITAMTPRGTYDDPSVGNARYAVPRYVDDEGYGQGAFVTKWLPRGYYGPEIPAYLDQTFSKIVGESPASGGGVTLKMETLGDDSPGYSTSHPKDRFQQFGRRSAAVLMLAMDKLPPEKRPLEMRRAMDAIDPRLYQRTITYADRLARMGARPRVALAHGLAAGITEGMLAELKRSGQSRTAPQTESLPGLGCYGCEAALGATPTFTIVGKVVDAGPVEGSCSADGKYRWTQGAWSRLKAGEVCTGPITNQGPTQSTGGTGTTVTATNVLQVGPGIELPINAQRGSELTFDSPAYIQSHPELAAWIRSAWTTGEDKKVTYDVAASALPPQAMSWLQAVGITSSDKINFARVTRFVASAPYKFTHPIDGKQWGIWIGLTNLWGTGAIRDPSQPIRLVIWTQVPPNPNFLQRALSVVAKVTKPLAVYGGGVLAAALSTVGELACNLVNQPGSAAAAGAASGGAAAVGVSIAAGLCAPDGSNIPVPPAPEDSDLTLPLAIGAGAIGLALLLKNRKKKA